MKLVCDNHVIFSYYYRLKQLIESNFSYFILYLWVKKVKDVKGIEIYFSAEDWHSAFLTMEKEAINVIDVLYYNLPNVTGSDVVKLMEQIKGVYPSIIFKLTSLNKTADAVPTIKALDELACEFSLIISNQNRHRTFVSIGDSIYSSVYKPYKSKNDNKAAAFADCLDADPRAVILTLLQVMPALNSSIYNIDERFLYS